MGLLLNIAGGGSAHLRAVDGGRRARRAAIELIAAGGTAGHVVPAIAVADALRAEGADVRFVGGERAEAELVPAAGYELDPLNVEGISRSNPLKAARAVGKASAAAVRRRAPAAPPPRRRRGGRRRLRGRAGRPGGGPARHPARPHRGRLPPRPHQPAARRPRAARLPRVPDRGPQRRALPGHRPPGPADRRPTAPPRGRSSGSRTARPRCSCSAARSGRARSTRPRSRAFADAPYRDPARRRAARLRHARPRPARTTSCATTWCRSARAGGRRPRRWRAPAARCSSSRSTGCRRC